ncbi:MAG: peptidylprolyl isomerase, partial [Cryomorphaceae bacterium]
MTFQRLLLPAFMVLAMLVSPYIMAQDGQDEKRVIIRTDYGDMIVKLYDDTPQHRDNFLKLVGEGFYDGLLFHRVISGFMIQGGDPDSKNAPDGAALGTGGMDYRVPAEIVPGRYHKKGALAAARQSDQVNPAKESSGCQFYIVQGRETP